ncbi:hypothetical protein CRG49_008735 [Neisseria sp. N95_16]|uniref:Uncharacterized protein n=1 Tax=Neisseria brasiliensis TaxID=2666100 RepID=A0A7X2KX28_9NEIS|nr:MULTISPECIES: hypothetical protein [Neisseria]MRN37216.1 hypothetical protein [Neisseria brasiliensis]PJO09233.1 hypothetical protein CRG49_008735 [Neisseria sp. N95_16]
MNDTDLNNRLAVFARQHKAALSVLSRLAAAEKDTRQRNYRYALLGNYLLRGIGAESLSDQMQNSERLLIQKRIVNQYNSLANLIEQAKNIDDLSSFNQWMSDHAKAIPDGLQFDELPDYIAGRREILAQLQSDFQTASNILATDKIMRDTAADFAKSIIPTTNLVEALETAKIESAEILPDLAAASGDIVVYGRAETNDQPISDTEREIHTQIKSAWAV